MNITLSPDQTVAYDKIMHWFVDKSKQIPYLRLGGYAGTGKTTLTSKLRENLPLHDKQYVWYAAFTGKAAAQLRSKLDWKQFPDDKCTTLHRLLYTAIINKETGRIIGWTLKPSYPDDKPPPALIVVDEASMVPKKIHDDLLTLGIPIFYTGDHGQLPPIQHKDEPPFNLMHEPDLKLEKIHRQAADNPIIRLATTIRTNGDTKFFISNHIGLSRAEITNSRDIPDDLANNLAVNLSTSIILTDTNYKRVNINKSMRRRLGFDYEGPPVVTDKVICLRNDYNSNPPVFNGQIGYIERITDGQGIHWYDVCINMDADDKPFNGRISTHFFNNPRGYWDNKADGVDYADVGNQFDYGYGITVHKSQGSEFDTVVVCGNGKCFRENQNRWLYTAITRAKERVVWFKNM